MLTETIHILQSDGATWWQAAVEGREGLQLLYVVVLISYSTRCMSETVKNATADLLTCGHFCVQNKHCSGFTGI